MSIFGNLVGEIADGLVRGWVTKAANGFVTKGFITEAQVPELVDGVMLEMQIGMDEYKASQANPQTG